eukprot:1617264-Amphidinium_carterae.1
MLRTQHHRHIHAVREEAAVSAHIVAAKIEEHAIVYPDLLLVRAVPAAPAATPVSWRIPDCGQVKTVATVLLPTTSSAGV